MTRLGQQMTCPRGVSNKNGPTPWRFAPLARRMQGRRGRMSAPGASERPVVSRGFSRLTVAENRFPRVSLAGWAAAERPICGCATPGDCGESCSCPACRPSGIPGRARRRHDLSVGVWNIAVTVTKASFAQASQLSPCHSIIAVQEIVAVLDRPRDMVVLVAVVGVGHR